MSRDFDIEVLILAGENRANVRTSVIRWDRQAVIKYRVKYLTFIGGSIQNAFFLLSQFLMQ